MMRKTSILLFKGLKQLSKTSHKYATGGAGSPSVAINGLGRIGKCLLRKSIEQKINVVAINQPWADMKKIANSLTFDTVQGPFVEEIVQTDDTHLCIGGKSVRVFHEEKVENIKWKDVSVDYVIEATGRYTEVELAKKHIAAGAKKVVISAPSRDAPFFVRGVNFEAYSKTTDVVSSASCVTNCAAPLLKILHDKFGVVNCMLTTTHAMTASQPVHDGIAHRSGVINIVPSKRGADREVNLALPDLKGKVGADSATVPVLDVTLLKLYANVEKNVCTEAIKSELRKRMTSDFKGLVACIDNKCVSSDFIGCQLSAVVDSNQIQVIDKFVSIAAWYDNEMAYSCRVLDLIRHMMEVDKK